MRCFVVRAAPFALLFTNSRKTERGARQFLALFCGARRTPCATFHELAQNGARREAVPCAVLWCAPHPLRYFSRTRAKRSAARGSSLRRFVVRAAPFALLFTNSRKTERGARQFLALFCGARRALCATFHELAQNGARREAVPCAVLWCAPHPLRYFSRTRAKRSAARGGSWAVLWYAPHPLRYFRHMRQASRPVP